MRTVVPALFVCLCIAGGEHPAFEVASVKTSATEGRPLRVTSRVDADGINFTNMTLRLCLQRAFEVKPYQIAGPDWIETNRFVIVAKAAAPTSSKKLMEMLQTLLIERFKLSFHREGKEMPVYALVIGKSGPKMKEATDDGAAMVDGGDNGELVFDHVTMGILTGVLARSLDRPVLDQTGLKGQYNFKLAWAENKRKGAAPEMETPEAPSVFSAVQKTLGLKLEPRKQPIDRLVIDHVERPTEN